MDLALNAIKPKETNKETNKQVPILQVRVDQGVVAIKKYSTFHQNFKTGASSPDAV